MKLIQGRKRLITWWQEFKKWFPTAPLEFRQENEIRRDLQVSHIFAVRIVLGQSKQTRFCQPFNNWRRTVVQPSSITTAESRNCPNPSQRHCPPLTGSQRNSSCLKICSKQVWKLQSTQRRRQNEFHPLSSVVLRYKHSKTSPASTERIWEKFWLCSLENTWNLSQWLQQNTNFNEWSSTQRTRKKIDFLDEL